MSHDDHGDLRAEQLRRALAELRAQSPSTQASALGDYEPELAAAAARQLADEEAAFERLLPLHGDAFAAALAELDTLTAEGVRWRREMLAVDDPLLGTVDHDFRLQNVLGVGGGGRVYEVERQSYPQTMALKLIAGWDQAARRRFDRERAVLARMHHPFIVQLADAWERADGRNALLMELVHGKPITSFADERRLGLDGRLELLGRVTQAVTYAHQLGVYHRDLKPANILVTADGTPKVLDFGIAQILDESGQTRSEGFVGTFAYASPEQLRRQGVDARTDVYALGVVLFELLVSLRPHAGDVGRLADPLRPAPQLRAALAGVSAERRGEIAAGRGLSAAELRRRLGGDLAAVVAKALHPEHARRYPTVADFAADLDAVRNGRAVAARGDSLWYGVRRWAGRNRMAAGLAATLLIGLPAFGVRDYWQRTRQEKLVGVMLQGLRSTLDAVPGLTDLPLQQTRVAKMTFLQNLSTQLMQMDEYASGLMPSEGERIRLDIAQSQAQIALRAGDRDVGVRHAEAVIEHAASLAADPNSPLPEDQLLAIRASALLQIADYGDDEARQANLDLALTTIDTAIAATPDDLDPRVTRLTILEHRLNHRKLLTGTVDHAEMQRWIDEARAVAARFGANPTTERLLVLAALREAEIARGEERFDDAASGFEQAATRLADWPEQARTWEILRLHARTCRQLGDVNLMRGEEERSWPWFERAVAMSEQYVAQDPDDVEMVSGLANGLYYHGQALRQQGKVAEARSAYERMLVVQRGLTEKDPGNRDFLRSLVLHVYQVADFEGAAGNADGRLQYLQQATDRVDDLVAPPDAGAFDIDFAAELHTMLAAFRRDAGDDAAADVNESRSVALYERCVALGGDAAVAAEEKLAALRCESAERRGEWAEAVAYRQRCVDATRVEADAELPALLQYGQSLYRLALCQSGANLWTEAQSTWLACCGIWRAVVDRAQDPVFRPAYRDVLLRTCECMVEAGTLGAQREFLVNAVKFCNEWREQPEIAARIDAIEAAARSAGMAAATVDAIFRREK
ncbi:MAG: serine/threonine protein kinase [Planctomycetes bacterium]|nr:serine/threonine protein kinase [Planctomycetota bacterium]